LGPIPNPQSPTLENKEQHFNIFIVNKYQIFL
jgi:hypothetical protein